MPNLCHFTTNVSGSVRYDTLEGRDYLVVPMVMLTEGVHGGSLGDYYYPPDELSRLPTIWNHKPVVVYHPEINGVGVSACDPIIINSRKIGLVLNTRWDAPKLRAEAWLEISRIPEVDGRVLEALEADKMMEVSTGVFTEPEMTEGDWNGEHYTAIARNLQADHLAILPDRVGACSIADGAGLLQLNSRPLVKHLRLSGVLLCNEMSHSDVRSDLFRLIRERFGEEVWIEDVFDQTFVYSRLDKLFRLGYTAGNADVTLEEGPSQEVVRVTDFVSVANERKEDMADKFDKDEFVGDLIGNAQSRWEEGDKEFLLTLEQDQLEKMVPTEPTKPEDGEKGLAEAKREANKKDPVQNEETPEQDTEVTADQYISNAPSEIRDMLTAGLLTHNQQKDAMVKQIMENKANRFTKEQLESEPIGKLQAIAELCAPATNEEEGSPSPMFVPNYAGAGGSHANVSDHNEEPYVAPVMNWAD